MAVATIMANTKLIVYLKSEIAKLNDKNNMETTINPFKKTIQPQMDGYTNGTGRNVLFIICQ
jgi:hypothetical protein